MKKHTFIAFVMAFCSVTLEAQVRYMEPIFSQVSRTTTVYGNNHSVITLTVIGHTIPIPQRVDVYKPVGDTVSNRPLIIYLQTGSFLPISINGSCGGEVTDSSNVEFATRLAKMGYVVAVATYRLGWRPDLPTELERRFTLINAAYRGVQDVRSCIRFFRKTVAEQGNPFGIDPNKVVVWGQGTGGFVSLAAAYLNTYDEILTTSEPKKFSLLTASGPIPMIDPAYNGDIYGYPPAPLTVCKVDAAYNAITGFPIGDTLSTFQNQGYPSNFNLCVNMGGALFDSTWLDADEIPLISYHVPTPNDFFAPCGTGILKAYAANGPLPLLKTTGSCDLHELIEANGMNNVFGNIPAALDPYKVLGFSGFRPFYYTPEGTSAPWEWRAGNAPSSGGDCNNDGAVARAYIDTIITFFAPRACVALALGCGFVDAQEPINEAELGLTVSPVPAVDAVMFQTKGEEIRSIYVYDLQGRLVKAHLDINSASFRMERNVLANGLYFAELHFDKGAARRRIMFTNN
jgi:hypothetical protein